MAFRLPTQAPPRRTTSYSHPQPSPALDVVPPASSQLPDDESTQWVLFSPSQPSTTAARTHTNSTERTAGASRLSDLDDSFGTQTRSVFELGDDDDVEDEDDDNVGEQGNNDNDILDEEGTELDSLDDGLHAFRAPSLVDDESPAQQQVDQASPAAAAVLPTHDGLGSFQASSRTVQDQLWQHEQYNPQRRPELRLRRQSSVQRHLDMVAEQEQMTNAERERWQRIEKWRMEQSRALLQEVERETRRRRRRTSRASRTSDHVSSASFSSSRHQRVRSESLQSVPETPDERPASLSSSSSQTTEPGTDEPFWRRITRKVIRDLIGIDDSVLSVIFGESLPDDVLNQEYDDNDNDNDTPAGTGSTALKMDEAIRRELGSGLDDQNHWQTKLLQRISHELGVLVHQLCEHPGAFTTYLNMSNSISNEYAGIPVGRTEDDTQNRVARTSVPSTATETTSNDDSILPPHFGPTLPDPSGREHAAQWGIEDDDPVQPLSESARLQQEKEYWERELDIMMVFRYLRNRFSARNNNTDSTTTSPSHRQPQDASRRAAIIRQHHPLVARAQSRSQTQHSRRQSQHSAAAASAGPTGISSPLLRQNFRRPSSSCASHSAKLSAISSRRPLTASSRNYWDIGGSVESGSAIAPVGGGMGSWGDV